MTSKRAYAEIHHTWTEMRDNGNTYIPRCSCGWQSRATFNTKRGAEDEASDHAVAAIS